MQQSSISDYDSFRTAVYQAATDDNKFKNFLKTPEILRIFGHYKYENALKIWNKMQDRILECSYFPDNQIHGMVYNRKDRPYEKTPEKQKFELLPQYDRYDTFTSKHRREFTIQCFLLEFIRVGLDIKDKLNLSDLYEYSIVELGVGFLGQYLTFFGDYKNYYMIDLPEVLLLANKIIKKSTIGKFDAEIASIWWDYEKTDFVSTFDLQRFPFENKMLDENGIFFSSHAFSELTKEHQDIVYDNVIKHCKYGYILMNQISHIHGISSYSMEDNISNIKSLGKNVEVHEEWPLTFKGNHVITWNTI